MATSAPLVRVGVAVFVLASKNEDRENPRFLVGRRKRSTVHGSGKKESAWINILECHSRITHGRIPICTTWAWRKSYMVLRYAMAWSTVSGPTKLMLWRWNRPTIIKIRQITAIAFLSASSQWMHMYDVKPAPVQTFSIRTPFHGNRCYLPGTRDGQGGSPARIGWVGWQWAYNRSIIDKMDRDSNPRRVLLHSRQNNNIHRSSGRCWGPCRHIAP